MDKALQRAIQKAGVPRVDETGASRRLHGPRQVDGAGVERLGGCGGAPRVFRGFCGGGGGRAARPGFLQ